jgi:hypothetical protein
MDEHDVTNAEFSKFVEATGYATTAERKIDWEDLKKEVPAGTPKLNDKALAPGAPVFTPTSGSPPSMTCRLGGVGCTCAKLASFGLQNDEGLIRETN